jgi:hypothetical protein
VNTLNASSGKFVAGFTESNLFSVRVEHHSVFDP